MTGFDAGAAIAGAFAAGLTLARVRAAAGPQGNHAASYPLPPIRDSGHKTP